MESALAGSGSGNFPDSPSSRDGWHWRGWVWLACQHAFFPSQPTRHLRTWHCWLVLFFFFFPKIEHPNLIVCIMLYFLIDLLSVFLIFYLLWHWTNSVSVLLLHPQKSTVTQLLPYQDTKLPKSNMTSKGYRVFFQQNAPALSLHATTRDVSPCRGVVTGTTTVMTDRTKSTAVSFCRLVSATGIDISLENILDYEYVWMLKCDMQLMK